MNLPLRIREYQITEIFIETSLSLHPNIHNLNNCATKTATRVNISLFKCDDGYALTALAEWGKLVFGYMRMPTQLVMNGFSQCTGPFAVKNTDCRDTGEVRIIKILIGQI